MSEWHSQNQSRHRIRRGEKTQYSIPFFAVGDNSFPSFFAFKEGIWDTHILALLSSPTVSGHFLGLLYSEYDVYAPMLTHPSMNIVRYSCLHNLQTPRPSNPCQQKFWRREYRSPAIELFLKFHRCLKRKNKCAHRVY